VKDRNGKVRAVLGETELGNPPRYGLSVYSEDRDWKAELIDWALYISRGEKEYAHFSPIVIDVAQDVGSIHFTPVNLVLFDKNGQIIWRAP
jgi:hypothetical protein